MADQWDSHFAALSPTPAPAVPSSAGADWEGHFTALAPQASPTPQASPQNTSWIRLPAMALSTVAGAVGNFLGLPGDLNRGFNAGANFLTGNNLDPQGAATAEANKLGVPAVPGVPSSGDITGEMAKLGLTNRSELTPTGPLEKYGTAAIGGLATGAMAALTGGGSLIPNLAAGLAGNEAGEAVHEAAPDSKWGPVIAGLLAGMGVGGVAGAVQRSMTASKAAKALESAQAELEAAHSDKFYGAENARQTADRIQAASKQALEFKQQLINTVKEDAGKATGAQFETTAAQLGDSSTLQQAGQALQSEARNWISTTLPAKLKAAWAPVDSAIPKDMQLGLNNFHSALEDINTSAGKLEPLAALLKPALPAKLAKTLKAPEELGELTLDAGEEPGGAAQYSWKDISKLRSTLGDALHNPQVIKEVGATNLDRLYASLTSDMSAGAQRAGAGDLFNAANAESRRLYQIGEGPMSKLVAGARRSAEDPNPESVAASLLSSGKKGASDLAVLRDEIPEGVNELAAAHLRTTGPSTAGWGKLAPETQRALVPSTDQSAALNSSLAARTAAEENAERELLAAKRDHAEISGAADESARTGNFTRSERVMLAQKAVAQAKAAIPEAPSPVTNLVHRANSLIGAGLGYNFAPAIMQQLEIPSNPLAIGALSAAGLALPYVGRSLKGVLRNPASAAPAVVGGVAGRNPLSLGRQ